MKLNPNLEPFRATDLRAELIARGELHGCTLVCDSRQHADLNVAALDQARALLAAGDLAEAAIWIGRAHPHLARLPDLLARASIGEA